MWVERFGDVDELIFYIFCGAATIIALLGFIAILVPCYIPNITPYTPGGTIDFNIIIGGRLITLTVLIRGVSTTWTGPVIINIFCQFYPAALLVGLTLFAGGFLIKGIAISSNSWKSKPTAISDEWKPNLAILGLVIVIGVAAAIWCVMFKPVLSEVTGKQYMCYNSNADFEWKVATSCWHALLLVLALFMIPFQLIKSRNTPFSPESLGLSAAIVNTALCVVAGICVEFLYTAATPTIKYAIIGGLELWMVFLADVVMVAAKIKVADSVATVKELHEEHYDIIKEDHESGESTQLDTLTATSSNNVLLTNPIISVPQTGAFNNDSAPGSSDPELQEESPDKVVVDKTSDRASENYSVLNIPQHDSIDSESELYNYHIRQSITILSA